MPTSAAGVPEMFSEKALDFFSSSSDTISEEGTSLVELSSITVSNEILMESNRSAKRNLV